MSRYQIQTQLTPTAASVWGGHAPCTSHYMAVR